jgi:pimeloyl-[acyl-carrier protein] methyl ester esterase
MNQLVLWHGWGMQPAVWDGFAAQLASQYGLTPHAQALPGYAAAPTSSSSRRGSALGVPDTLDDLVDAMLAGLPDLSTPITLCGWSFGAMLAMHAAQRCPDKVARLILIGATPSFVRRVDWPHGMTPHALAEFAEAVGCDPKTALKRFIALFNQNDVNGRRIGRDLVRALTADELPPAPILTAGLALLRDIDLRDLLPNIVQPTLLLHGAHDPLMSLAGAEWLAVTLPQARLAVLPDAAHAPFLSDAVGCAALIADFLHA